MISIGTCCSHILRSARHHTEFKSEASFRPLPGRTPHSAMPRADLYQPGRRSLSLRHHSRGFHRLFRPEINHIRSYVPLQANGPFGRAYLLR